MNSRENAGGKIGKVEVREVGVENSLVERIEEAQSKAKIRSESETPWVDGFQGNTQGKHEENLCWAWGWHSHEQLNRRTTRQTIG